MIERKMLNLHNSLQMLYVQRILINYAISLMRKLFVGPGAKPANIFGGKFIANIVVAVLVSVGGK